MSIHESDGKPQPINESDFLEGINSRLTIGELELENAYVWRAETPAGCFEGLILVRFIRTYDLGRKTANYVGFDPGRNKSDNPEGTTLKQFDADSLGLVIPPFGVHYFANNDTPGWNEALSAISSTPASIETDRKNTAE